MIYLVEKNKIGKCRNVHLPEYFHTYKSTCARVCFAIIHIQLGLGLILHAYNVYMGESVCINLLYHFRSILQR